MKRSLQPFCCGVPAMLVSWQMLLSRKNCWKEADMFSVPRLVTRLVVVEMCE